MKRLLTMALLAIFTAILPPGTASAHVLVTDRANSQGAVLHITPDDDPIAGQEAKLFLNTGDLGVASGQSTTMIVTDSNGQNSTVRASAAKSHAQFAYTFPTQGAYTLQFYTTGQSNTKYHFTYDLRVSRGVSSQPVVRPYYAWADALTIVGLFGLGAVIVIAFSRRSSISKQSTF